MSELDEKPKFMWIGKPRCGKTMQLWDFGGFEEGNSKLVANIDNKLTKVRRMLEESGKGKIKEIESYDDFDFENDRDLQVITIPLRGFEKLDRLLRHGVLSDYDSKKPGVFMMDSLTLMADDILKYALGFKSQRRADDIGVIDIFSWPEYKAESSYLASLFGDLKALDSIVVLTAHLTVKEDEVQEKAEPGTPKFAAKGKTMKTERIVMTGGKKIGLRMPAYFHEIYYAKVEPAADYINDPPKRLFLSVPTDDCDFAGSQLGVPVEMDVTFRGNEDDKSLWDYVKEHLKG